MKIMFSYSFVFFAIQQKFLFNPKTTSKAPITVRAMFAQEGCHQAKTMTSTARITRQKQNDILYSFCQGEHRDLQNSIDYRFEQSAKSV